MAIDQVEYEINGYKSNAKITYLNNNNNNNNFIELDIFKESIKLCIHRFQLVKKVKVKYSMARSLPVENLLAQNVESIINYLQ